MKTTSHVKKLVLGKFLGPAIAVITTCFAPVAQAAVLVTTVDSTIKQVNPTTNFGSDTTLVGVGNAAASGSWQKSYILFDASGLTGQTLTSVSGLTMVYTPASNRSGTFYLITGAGANSWTETGITWNNAPANDTASGIGFSGAGFTATTLGSATGNGSVVPITLSISGAAETALLSALNTGDRMATIAFAHVSSSNTFTVYSSDFNSGASSPYLTYTAVPEPSTFALIGLGLAAVACFRRRK